MQQRLAIFILFFSSIGWGLTWWPLKKMNELGLDGLLLVVLAFGSAGLMLIPVLLKQRNTWLKNWRLLGLIALFGGLANVSFQTAIYQGDVIRVMILFYLLPVWSVIGGKLIFKERIDSLRSGAVIASILGAALILGIDGHFFNQFSYLDVLGILSGLAFALNNFVFRATPEIPVASKVSAMFVGCALMMVGYVFISGIQFSLPQTVAATSYAIAYGMVWITMITFGTQWGVTHLEAGRASLIIVLELVVAVVSASIIMQTPLSVPETVGGMLVLSAAIIEASRESALHSVPG